MKSKYKGSDIFMNDASNNAKTAFIMPDTDVTVIPKWKHTLFDITEDGIISANSTLKAIPYDSTNPNDLVIPAEVNGINVTKIDDFSMCKSLRIVTISDGPNTIEDFAFNGCTTMLGIKIPSSVITVGRSAFEGNSYMQAITFSEGLLHILDGAFANCSIMNIQLPFTLTDIGDRAFYGYNGMGSIDIPPSVTTIGIDAFAGGKGIQTIDVYKPANSIAGAPWGATNATVNWLG